jgi:hypothetical protein
MEGSDGGTKYCVVSLPCPRVYGQNDENSRLKIYFSASKTQGSAILEYVINRSNKYTGMLVL